MYRQQRLGRRQHPNQLRQRVDDEAGLLRYVALSQQRGIRPVAFADEPKALNRRSQLAAVPQAPIASEREPLQHHEQHQSEEPRNGDVGSSGVKPRVCTKHPPVYAGTPRSFCHGLLASRPARQFMQVDRLSAADPDGDQPIIAESCSSDGAK